jgi:hypothetical protein
MKKSALESVDTVSVTLVVARIAFLREELRSLTYCKFETLFLPSRQGEFHPKSLTEPCINVFVYTARANQAVLVTILFLHVIISVLFSNEQIIQVCFYIFLSTSEAPS